MPWRSPDRRDAVRQIAVDVVVEREPAVGARWIAPIHDVKIDAELEKIADQRAVFLQVGHRVAADQPVDDQHRRRDLLLGKRPVVMQRDLVLTPDLILRRRGNRDVLVAQLGKQRRAARDLFAEGRGLRDRLLGLDMNGRTAARHDDVLRFGSYWPHEWSVGFAGRLVVFDAGPLLAPERAQLAPQLGHGAMHVVELFARRVAEHLAVKSRHLLLREAQVRAGLQHFALARQVRVGALRFQQGGVRGLNPQRQHLAPRAQPTRCGPPSR